MIDGHETVLISYADQGLTKAQRLNSFTGKHLGRFDRIIPYSPNDIDEKFYEDHRDILSLKRGAGEWLWKPYIILKTLEELNPGDYLFYCDSGAFILHSCRYIFDAMNETDLWVSDIPLIEKQWTKPIVFQRLGVLERADILNSNQIQGGFVGIRKSTASVSFVRDWLTYCCNRELLLPLSEDEEIGDCIAHREDQSLLSVLCKVNEVKTHRDPTQYGRIPEKYKGLNA